MVAPFARGSPATQVPPSAGLTVQYEFPSFTSRKPVTDCWPLPLPYAISWLCSFALVFACVSFTVLPQVTLEVSGSAAATEAHARNAANKSATARRRTMSSGFGISRRSCARRCELSCASACAPSRAFHRGLDLIAELSAVAPRRNVAPTLRTRLRVFLWRGRCRDHSEPSSLRALGSTMQSLLSPSLMLRSASVALCRGVGCVRDPRARLHASPAASISFRSPASFSLSFPAGTEEAACSRTARTACSPRAWCGPR